MERLPEDIDYVEIQFIAEHLLALYAMVAQYGGVVVMYSEGDNVMRAYIPDKKAFKEFIEKNIDNFSWADIEKINIDVERVRKILGSDDMF